MDAIQGSLFDLLTARRLILRAETLEKSRNGKIVKEKTAKDAMEEDQALLSGMTPGDEVQQKAAQPVVPAEESINLGDLIHKLKELRQNTAPELRAAEVNVQVQESVEVSFTVSAYTLEPVEGLVLRNSSLAETDRYRFEFTSTDALAIVDKYTNRSTRIWGDPHVDTNDQEGAANGEFSDLKGSDQYTTFMLLDGTRLTFTARDSGLIEAVDIFKGDQHLHGKASGDASWDRSTGHFDPQVDQMASAYCVPAGDVVYAGGDGNDWFDAARRLVWGQTTGPAVMVRPSAVVSMEYAYRYQRSVNAQVVNRLS